MILDLHDVVAAVWDRAWARHGNQLSWYIRPLFLVPLALAAHRRSWRGIVLTLIALLTSMAWFPAPDTPSPRVQDFLATRDRRHRRCRRRVRTAPRGDPVIRTCSGPPGVLDSAP